MSILILGANGNMGKRYATILKHLGKETIRLDWDYTPSDFENAMTKADGVIIATPTTTHAELISKCNPFRKPILCEKPISKDVSIVKNVLNELDDSKTPFSMVFQYEELLNHFFPGVTYYNYFKHGGDGLVWDCIQLIGLAEDAIILGEDSPVWRCQINGHSIDISQMDGAYIDFISKWLLMPKRDLGFIREIHEKTAEVERTAVHGGNDQRLYWNPSKVDEQTVPS